MSTNHSLEERVSQRTYRDQMWRQFFGSNIGWRTQVTQFGSNQPRCALWMSVEKQIARFVLIARQIEKGLIELLVNTIDGSIWTRPEKPREGTRVSPPARPPTPRSAQETDLPDTSKRLGAPSLMLCLYGNEQTRIPRCPTALRGK